MINKNKTKLRFFCKIVASTTIICALCLAMTSCNGQKSQITIEQLIKANSAETLLGRYTSVYAEDPEFSNYMDSGLRYAKHGGVEQVQTPDKAYRCTDGKYAGYLVIGGVWESDNDYYSYVAFNPVVTALETIEKTVDNGDTIDIHTTLSGKLYETIPNYKDFGYENLKTFTCIYTVDKKTLAIAKVVETIYYTDGTVKESPHLSISYNKPRPERADLMLERLADEEKLRTATLITDPGTDKETTSKAYSQKGELIMISSEVTEKWQLYTDIACTKPSISGSNLDEDITIYAKQK